MLEPPSHDLVRQLTELQLCGPSDLRRARGRVRRLAHDLPAFDSVWIDSLVQLRLLTPYQAKRLEAGEADQLRIGSLVVTEELGRSDQGTTLLARSLNRHDRCVIKRLPMAEERIEAAVSQMQSVLDRTEGFAHPHLIVPHAIVRTSGKELVVVSRLAPGLPLNELLVRRGRFPAAVVLDIGRQLLEGLAALHKRSLLHGDIRMSNVRLTENGLAVLVDAGLRSVLHPEITIHDKLSLEAYDGLAPELIGTGLAPTASSELYSIGCLLWQLLAGRPPFITADPLAKIAAHQTRLIDDVRTLAPDTPPLLAETIRQMTSPAPNQRPRGFDEVLQRWGRSGSFGRSRLKKFRQLFDTSVPHFSHPLVSSGNSHWAWFAALTIVCSVGIAMSYDKGLRGELLVIVQNMRNLANDNAATAQTSGASRDNRSIKNLRPLPKPSADGVVTLTEPGPYLASVISFPGHLTIRGLNGVGSEIVVEDEPLTLTAQRVNLDHITVHTRKSGQSTFLTKVHCQQLQITHCEFATNVSDRTETTATTMGLAWKPIDQDLKLGTISVKNSIFRGSSSAILLAQPPRVMQISNTLKTGRGAFLALGPKSSAADCQLELRSVTLRQSGELLHLSGDCTRKVGIAPIVLSATSCVFDLADSPSGLIGIEYDQLRADIKNVVEMNAAESFISPGSRLLVAFDAEQSQHREIDADEHFEGLEVCEVQFAGNQIERALDARAVSLKGPRRAIQMELPGVEIRLLGSAVRASVQQD